MNKLPYWTCPDCGSNIDHGERCDCKKPRVIATINAKNRIEAKNALEMLLEKLKTIPLDAPIEERVEVINEGIIL